MTPSTTPDPPCHIHWVDQMPKLGTLFAGNNGEDFTWTMGVALENVEFKAQSLYSFPVSFRPTEVSDWCWPLFWCYLGNMSLLIFFFSFHFISCISFSVLCLSIILSVVTPEITKCILTSLQSPLN